MAVATPDIRLPSRPQSIASILANLYCLVTEAGVCVSGLCRAVLGGTVGERLRVEPATSR